MRTICRREANFNENLIPGDYKVCFYCGEFGDTIDHIRPLAKGGTDEYYNLRWACNPCNSEKSCYLIESYRNLLMYRYKIPNLLFAGEDEPLFVFEPRVEKMRTRQVYYE